MKKCILLLIILVESNLFGQTDSLEKATLLNKLKSKEISDATFSKIMPQWMELIDKVKYPDLPLDQNGKVHYTFINELKGFNKEILFKRTQEWLAINYGLLSGDMYSDLEGKIILRNSLSLIYNYSCVFTSIFSIKDEKIKLDILSISYQAYYEGDNSSGIPEKNINININEVYPVILKKPAEWNINLTLLKATNKLFNTEINNLKDYILSYEDSNNF